MYTISAIVMFPIGIESVVKSDFTGMNTHLWAAAAFVLITYIQPVLAVSLSVAMGLDVLHLDTALFAVVLFAGVWMVISSYRR